MAESTDAIHRREAKGSGAAKPESAPDPNGTRISVNPTWRMSCAENLGYYDKYFDIDILCQQRNALNPSLIAH